MTNSFVYCTFQLEGIHNWPDCPIEEVKYLRDPHRHMFHFKLVVPVSHSDRDVEFIWLKHEAIESIESKYYDQDMRCCNFGASSCEHLCDFLLEQFPVAVMVEVSEDGENGGFKYREEEPKSVYSMLDFWSLIRGNK